MIRAQDPNTLLKTTPFSPTPFINVPDEPRPLNKLKLIPRTTLLHPLRDVWNGVIRDTVNLTP